MKIGNFLRQVRNTPPVQAFYSRQDGQAGGARRGATMTRGGGKRAAIGVALLIIALAGVAALASFDSSGSSSGGLAAAQTTTDYDTDDDGLIEVSSLAQLNAIRWDLNGNGAPDSMTNASSYGTAFPNRDTAAATRMGCPETSVPADTTADCIGYELAETNAGYLDFDTDGDGDVDSSDSPSFPNWTPIGGIYSGEFKGNNRTISNLTINNSSAANVGLFAQNTGKISGLGLVNVSVTSTRSTTSTTVGALVGFGNADIISCYATGSVSYTGSGQFGNIGGLTGQSIASISASWSSVNVSNTGTGTGTNAGGLAGSNLGGLASITASYAAGAVSNTGPNGLAGGLVGHQGDNSSITASYAAGPVTATGTGGGAGGIRVGLGTNTAISATYWDVGTTGIADDANSDAPEGVSTSDLQSPKPYAGIYSTWNVNVDGVAGDDDPWAFGTGMQYPMLKWDGMSLPAQGSLAMGAPDVDTNGETPTVGRMARVCLTTGPVLRQAGTGGQRHQPWVWSRSADGVTWTNIAQDGGGTYEYTPVAADANNHLRACVPIISTDARSRGESLMCIRPFPPVQASN